MGKKRQIKHDAPVPMRRVGPVVYVPLAWCACVAVSVALRSAGMAPGWATLWGILALVGAYLFGASLDEAACHRTKALPQAFGQVWARDGSAVVVCALVSVLGMSWGLTRLQAQSELTLTYMATLCGSGCMAGLLAGVVVAMWQRRWRRLGDGIPTWERRVVDYAPAVTSLLFTWGMLYVRLPSMFQKGEMWAESATNYYRTAHFGSIWENIVATDAGYLPWAVRACALMVEALHIPAAYVPYAYQYVALFFIGVLSSLLALPQWRPFMRHDLARFLLCVGLGCQLDYDLKAFINFPYYAAMPAFAWLVMLPQMPALKTRTAVVGGLLLALLALSKPHFLTFAPVMGLLLLYGVYRRRRNMVLSMGIALAGVLLQASVLYHTRSVSPATDPPLSLSFFVETFMALAALVPWIGLAGKVTVAQEVAADPWLWPGVAAAVVAVVAVLQGLLGERWRSSMWVFLAGSVTFAASLWLTVLAFPAMASTVAVSHKMNFITHRWWFLPCLMIYVTFACLMARGALNRSAPWGLALWLIVTYPISISALPTDVAFPTVGYSAWQTVAPKVLAQAQPRGCIPVNPYPWVLGFNCRVLHAPPTATPISGWVELKRESQVPLAAPPGATDWQVDMLGLAVGQPSGDSKTKAKLTVEVIDSAGKVLGRQQQAVSGDAIFTYFHFPEPLVAPATLRIINDSPEAGLGIAMAGNIPFWSWFGRGPEASKDEGMAARAVPEATAL